MERITTCCFLVILLACLFALGSAFQPFNHPSQTTSALRLIGVRRDHYRHNRLSCKPLFGILPTDAPTVAYNEDFFIDTLGFSKDKLKTPRARKILTLENGVLRERVNRLKERLKLKEDVRKCHPDILGIRSDIALAPNLDYLQNRLLLDEKSLQKLIMGAPNMSTEDNLGPKLDYLQRKLRLDEESLRKLVLAVPAICRENFSIEDNLEPKLDYLQRKLLLDDKSLRQLILAASAILRFNIKDNLEPKLSMLLKRLMLDEAKLAKIITRFPSVMHLSTKGNIEPKLDWLQQRLDLDDMAVSKMIQRLPTILGYSIPDKLEPTLDWLQQRLSLTDSGLSNLMQRFPALFSYSVDNNTEPTLNFYIVALGDEGEALTLLIRSPGLFSYSLETRLKPRLSEARDAGLIIDAACMTRLGEYTEKQWHTSLDFQARKLARQ